MTWSISSGGRLTSKVAEHASFRITTDNAFDSILLRSVSVKQSFTSKLKRQLSRHTTPGVTSRLLSLAFQSVIVDGISGMREVELTVTVTDHERDSMIWYFMLRSPVQSISPDNLDEITRLIGNRLFEVDVRVYSKACL
jgi:hypothetical protein